MKTGRREWRPYDLDVSFRHSALRIPKSEIYLRRLLYLTYYYAPSGGSGVQRAVKMTRYLTRFGWHPTVVTVDPEAAAFPHRDATLLADIPDAVHVARTPTWDPYAMYAALQGRKKEEVVTTGFAGAGAEGFREALARWVRANLFIPDARVGWVPYAIAEARRLHARTPFDALVTTGPPHSTHLAGLWLSARLGLPWLADLRDPWTDIYYYRDLPRTAPAAALDAFFERAVLRRAHARVAVGPGLADHYRAKGGKPVHVIPNGFDPADFAAPAPPPDPETFVLAFVGTFLGQQNPRALWQVLADLRREGRIPAFRLRLVGTTDAGVRQAIADAGLDDVTRDEPPVSHPDAIRAMQAADALLLCINRVPGAAPIVTGKVYEYVASGRPVLGVGPPGGDAARVLDETGAGQMFDWDDGDGIRADVLRLYEAWAEGQPVGGATPQAALAYSRPRQAEALARVLDAIAPRP